MSWSISTKEFVKDWRAMVSWVGELLATMCINVANYFACDLLYLWEFLYVDEYTCLKDTDRFPYLYIENYYADAEIFSLIVKVRIKGGEGKYPNIFIATSAIKVWSP